MVTGRPNISYSTLLLGSPRWGPSQVVQFLSSFRKIQKLIKYIYQHQHHVINTHTSTTINGCFPFASRRKGCAPSRRKRTVNYYYLKLSITSRRSIYPVICFLKVRVLQRLINLFICYSLICFIPPSLPHHCRSFPISIALPLAPYRCHSSTPDKCCLRPSPINASTHARAHLHFSLPGCPILTPMPTPDTPHLLPAVPTSPAHHRRLQPHAPDHSRFRPTNAASTPSFESQNWNNIIRYIN